MKNNIVVGGGLTGIAGLKSDLFNGAELIDNHVELGGFTRSIHVDDFVFDYTGHFLHLSKFKLPSHIDKNISDSDWDLIEKKSACYYKGKFVGAPFQYNLFDLEELANDFYQSFLDRNLDISEEMNLENYFRSAFGELIAREFLIPYNNKLYGCSINRFSTDGLKRFFPHPDEEKILNGFKGTESALVYNSKFWYPKNNGIGLLIKALSTGVSHTYDKLEEIDLKQNIAKFSSGNSKNYSKLLSSIPLKNLAKISHFDGDFLFSNLSKNLTTSSTFALNLGFSIPFIPELQNLHWLYISEEEFLFHRIGFYSNFNNSLAPKGCSSIYVEVGLCDNLNPNVSFLVNRILQDLSKIGFFDLSKIISMHNLWMPTSYVHFTNESTNSAKEILEKFKNFNVLSAGRYGRWEYTSMEDSIIDGFNGGERVG